MKSRKPSIPYIIWMVVFTMIPIIMIGFTAFTDKNGNFSFQAFTNAFYYTNIFVKSLWIALISTAICLVLAYPLAYLLTRMKESTQNTLIMLLMIPMWMNFLLRIYAWVTLLQDNGPIDMMLSLLGIHSTYIGNTGAVILGMVYEYLPFMVLPIYNAVVKIDKDVINAAKDLGATNSVVLRKIIFPLSVPGIVSGITMVLVPSMSEFVIADMLGGGKIYLIGNAIEQAFNSGYADVHAGSGLSMSLMVLILISIVIYRIFDNGKESESIW